MIPGISILKKKKKREDKYSIINNDVTTIEEVLKCGNEEQMRKIHMSIEGKYSSYILNFGQSMYWYMDNKLGFNYEGLDKESLQHNLYLMKAKLEGLACGFNTNSISALPQNSISVNVPITNEINIDITFEKVRQKIEDMTGLTDSETDEIKSKIDDLEDISKEEISKKKKWEKVKPILKFAIDKGSDVAIAIMSLVLQMKLGM